MRQIKFRGKRKDNGVWVYGYLFKNYKHEVYILKPTPDYGDPKFNNGIGQYYYLHEVIPETVGQYTGLHDSTKFCDAPKEEQDRWRNADKKNTAENWPGVPIYEGDIAKGESIHCPKEVIFDCENAGYAYKDPDGYANQELDYGYHIKVIGNIHDNPELMESE